MLSSLRTAVEDELPIDLLRHDDPDLRERIGRHLGAVRQQKGLSQYTVAKAIKLSRPHLSNIEQGRSRTDWMKLQRLAKYYKFSLNEVIETCRSPDWIPAVALQALAPAVPSDDIFEVSRGERLIVHAIRLLTKSEQQRVMRYIERLLGLHNNNNQI